MSTPVARALGIFSGRVVSLAQILAPVLTGKLRNSLDFWTQGKKFIIGTRLYYARFQEYGTRRFRAQPFLHPATRQTLPYLQMALARETGEYISRELRSGGLPA